MQQHNLVIPSVWPDYRLGLQAHLLSKDNLILQRGWTEEYRWISTRLLCSNLHLRSCMTAVRP